MSISISERWRGWTTLAAVALRVGLLGLGAELAIRVVDEGWAGFEHPFGAWRAPIPANVLVRDAEDPHLVRVAPGWRGIVGGAEASFNRWGMRGREVSLRPAPGTVRVAVLGRSVTSGFGVPDDSVWTVQLERLMRGSAPQHYEVLNFAVEGSSLRQVLRSHSFAVRFQPSVVLLMVDAAELEATRVLDRDPGMGRWRFGALSRYSAVATTARGVWRVGMGRWVSGWWDRAQPTVPGRELLGRWLDSARAAGGPPVVIANLVWPDPQQRASPRARRALHDWAAERGVPLLDVTDEIGPLLSVRDEVWVWDVHPNGRGHRLFAAAIAERLPEVVDSMASRVGPRAEASKE